MALRTSGPETTQSVEEKRVNAIHYTELVAAAQQSSELDAYAAHLMYALAIYSLPEPLAKAGLKISHSERDRQLTVAAHGKTLRSHYEHVWLATRETPKPRLGGRIQFFADALHGAPPRMVYEILFDASGDARVDASRFFGNTIRKDDPEQREALRRIALSLVNAIHESMDTVDATADA
jgi:hypothetical protein